MMLNTVIITAEEYKLLVAKSIKYEMIANHVHEEMLENARSEYDTRCVSLDSIHLELLGLDEDYYMSERKKWMEERNANK